MYQLLQRNTKDRISHQSKEYPNQSTALGRNRKDTKAISKLRQNKKDMKIELHPFSKILKKEILIQRIYSNNRLQQ